MAHRMLRRGSHCDKLRMIHDGIAQKSSISGYEGEPSHQRWFHWGYPSLWAIARRGFELSPDYLISRHIYLEGMGRNH
jgi:hypothetical protein